MLPETTLANMEEALLTDRAVSTDTDTQVTGNSAGMKCCVLTTIVFFTGLLGFVAGSIKFAADSDNCPKNDIDDKEDDDYKYDPDCLDRKFEQGMIFGGEVAAGLFALTVLYIYRQSISEHLKSIPNAAANFMSSVRALCPATTEDNDDLIVPLPQGNTATLTNPSQV